MLPLRRPAWCGVAPPARADRLHGPEIDRAFTRMYNTDFRGAHESIDRYVSAQPADPLGYAVRASAYLFSELDRLGILESEFFDDDKRIIAKKGLRPDADVRAKVFQAVNDAQARGTADPGRQRERSKCAVRHGHHAGRPHGLHALWSRNGN